MISWLTVHRQNAVDINDRRSIFAIVYLAVVGPCVFILQPGFVAGLVAHLGLSEQDAGFVVSMEMFGLASTTVLLSFISHRVSWRVFLTACIAVCAIGNLVSIGYTDPGPLAAVRFVTGLGSGGLISITFTMAGLTRRSDRNFGHIIVWVLTYGAVGLLLMPTAYDLVGFDGVLAFFALFCASAIAFVRWLPDSSHAHFDESRARSYPRGVIRAGLAALLVYNTAVGIVWAYLFLVGLEAGMGEQAVANALTVSQFLGIAGAFLTVLFEARFGRLAPLMFGVLGGAVCIWILLGDLGASGYWFAVCGFNFLWNFSMPYMLATLADFDHRGRVVVHGVSMQFVGYAIGPFVAAQLLGLGGYDLVNGTGAVMFLVAAVVLVPALLAQRAHLAARRV